MKLIKFVFWIILLALFGVLIYQNRGFFLPKQSLDIDLYFTRYRFPDLPIAFMMIFMFFFGWLAAYLSGLADRFKLMQEKNRLQKALDSQLAAINAMRRDVEALKPNRESPRERPASLGQSDSPQDRDTTVAQTPDKDER
ncbi:MAG: hypothetical protein M0036_11340 [Desulfobacteraceae bacterium]|nr:hypothetical protein [Desulfobacteraceae bacterium]